MICPDNVAQRGIVVNIVRHHLQDAGKVDQGNECRIEPLPLCGIHQHLGGRTRVACDEINHVKDLLRIRGRSRNLRQESVRIQRNWRQQLVQLLR